MVLVDKRPPSLAAAFCSHAVSPAGPGSALLSTFLTRLFVRTCTRLYLVYNAMASRRTTNRHPPTKLRPQRCCSRPVGLFLPHTRAGVTQLLGAAARMSSPMPYEMAGKRRDVTTLLMMRVRYDVSGGSL